MSSGATPYRESPKSSLRDWYVNEWDGGFRRTMYLATVGPVIWMPKRQQLAVNSWRTPKGVLRFIIGMRSRICRGTPGRRGFRGENARSRRRESHWDAKHRRQRTRARKEQCSKAATNKPGKTGTGYPPCDTARVLKLLADGAAEPPAQPPGRPAGLHAPAALPKLSGDTGHCGFSHAASGHDRFAIRPPTALRRRWRTTFGMIWPPSDNPTWRRTAAGIKKRPDYSADVDCCRIDASCRRWAPPGRSEACLGTIAETAR